MPLNALRDTIQALGAERYAAKHGFVMPLVVGGALMAGGQHAFNTYLNAKTEMGGSQERSLGYPVADKHAALSPPEALMYSPLSGMAQGITSGIGGTINEGLNRLIFGREYGDRKDPMHLMGTAALTSFGREMGSGGARLLQGLTGQAMGAAMDARQEGARAALLRQLRSEDSVIADAEPKIIADAYATMVRFAPTLSTDKNAVRSFLRQAAMSGNGADYASIRLLADAERAVTPQASPPRR